MSLSKPFLLARQVAFLCAAWVLLGLGLGCTGGSGDTPFGNPTAASLAITPASPTIAAGETQPFAVVVVLSDGTTLTDAGSATDLLAWTSSDPTIATIDAKGVAKGVAAGTTTIRAGYQGVTGTATLQVTAAKVVSLAIDPPTPQVAAGLKLALKATATLSDGKTQDATALATWTSADTAIATVDAKGEASGVKVGASLVTAAFEGSTATATLQVTAAVLASLDVTPPTASLPQGLTVQLAATGTFSDGTTADVTSQVAWSSSSATNADVSNDAGKQGLVTAALAGQATITAALSGKSGTAAITVTSAVLKSLAVTPVNPLIAKGTTQPFIATGTYSDGSTRDVTAQATWTSSNTAIAEVSSAAGSAGLATGVDQGQSIITATIDTFSATATISVSSARLTSIEVGPASPSLAKGTTLQLSATGLYSDGSSQDITSAVTWSSAATQVASVSNATGSRGLASGLGKGSAVLTASFGAVSGAVTLTVTDATLTAIGVVPVAATIPNGTTQQFTAIGTYSDTSTQDLTAQVTWSSSNATLAPVSNAAGSRGLATGLGLGQATITAAIGSISGTATLDVTTATLSSIVIDPPAPTLASGSTLQLTATGLYSDGSSQDITSTVTWASSDSGVASLSNAAGSRGLATATTTGSVGVTATLGSVVGTTTLTVNTATLTSIAVSPAAPTIAAGTTQRMVAIGTYSDGSTQDLSTQVTWSSTNDAIATVSNTAGSIGVATGHAVGQAVLSATAGPISGHATLSVTAATLTGIAVTPAGVSIAKGTTVALTATGIYSDGSSQDITSIVTWSSSAPAIVPVSNAAGSRGVATALTFGSATITATFGATTGTSSLSVTAATLASIEVAPATPSIAKGTTVQLTATGTYSDGTTQDLTSQVTWSTGDGAVAAVSNVSGSEGLATGVGQGQTTATAAFDGLTGTSTLTVTTATLTGITVTPAAQTLAVGTTQQYTATGAYSDGSTQDITSVVSWASSASSVAAVSNASGARGLASALATGDTTISASVGAVTGQTSLTVSGATLSAIAVSPAAPSIAKGTTQQFTATGTFSDGTTQDLTAQAVWDSSSPAFATVSNAAASIGLATGLAQGQTTISASIGAVTGSATLTVSAATLVGINLSPTGASIAKGTTLQLTAIGTYSDGSTQDVTSAAGWSSANLAVVTISNAAGSRGIATGTGTGSTIVTATVGGVSGTTDLSVTSATLVRIDVTPAAPSIAKGTTQQFTATGTFSDSSTQNLTAQATWASSATSVATISNAAATRGLASGAGQGQTTISATASGVTGTATLNVTTATLTSLAVTPSTRSVAKGTTVAYAATGTYSDGTTQDVTSTVTWASSNAAVASISNAAGSRGLATAVATGSATISATLGAVSGTASLTVTAATLTSIAVTPTSPSIAKGTTQQFTATGTYSDGTTQNVTTAATWASSATGVATVSNALFTHGRATGVGAGQSTISATVGAVVGRTVLTVTSATLSRITVSPASTSIAKGTSLVYAATGFYSDATTQDLTSAVTWASSNGGVATVSNATGSRGVATGVATGTATISATLGAVSGQATLRVSAATLVSIAVTPASPSIAKGTTAQLVATGTYTDNSTQNVSAQVTWAATNPAIASVSGGLVTGLAVGQTAITATLGAVVGGTTLSVSAATLNSIAITPTTPSLAKGTTLQFAATGTYSDASTQDVTSSATWASSAVATASVSNAGGSRGLVTGVATGSATISATIGAVAGSTRVTVTAATLSRIDVTPSLATIAKGTTQPFAATGVYSDNSTQDLTATATWTSSAPSVADVSSVAPTSGLASALAIGQTTVAAQVGAVSGSATLTVTAATLTRLTVTPRAPSIAKGTSVQFGVTGTYSDGSTQDLTSTATWAALDATVATVSSAAGSRGLATGAGVGSTTVTASVGALSDSVTLTVTDATLTEITVSPVSAAIAKGTSQLYTATGIYSDNSTQDLSLLVTWASDDDAIAALSNAAGSRGLATGVIEGQVTVSATLGGVSGTASLSVTAATLVSISLSPTTPSIAKGTTTQFTATGLYTDGSSHDVTSAATWSSGTPSVATASNAAGSRGLATAIGTGTSTITATVGAVSASTDLTVTTATLASLTVTPATSAIAKGTSESFVATGVYTDGTTQDQTAAVTWTTSDATVASLDAAGLATANAVGQVTVTATLGAVSGTATLSVTAATLASIQVSPTDPSIAKGTGIQLAATGFYTDGSSQDVTSTATWSSADTTVAAVSNAAGARGLVTGTGAGSAVVTAAVGAIGASTTVTVTAATLVSLDLTPPNPAIAAGTSAQLTATGTYSDGSTQDLTVSAAWTTSAAAVATVSSGGGTAGKVAGVSAGQATITATIGAVSGTTRVTVTAATLASLDVAPVDPTIAKGTTLQFTVTGLYSDGTSQDLTSVASWTTASSAIATVSNSGGTRGLATGVAAGSTDVTATVSGVSGSSTLTVTSATLAAIDVSPVNSVTAIGVKLQYAATGTYSDGSTQDITTQVTWTSSNATVMSISSAVGSSGLASALKVGSVTITATSGALSGTANATVTASTLASITVTPANAKIARLTTQQYKATGNYSDGTSTDLTAQVTWTSSASGFATISNATATKGLVTGVAAGTTTISATLLAVTGSTSLTVSNATVTSIALSPTTLRLARYTQGYFRAVATFSDASTQDITTLATWTSSNTNVATASNTSPTQGRVSARGTTGTATIRAAWSGVTGSGTVTVTSATLTRITLTPATPTVKVGATLQMVATGTFSDSTTQVLTNQATWATATATTATVSNTTAARGIVTGVGAGSTNVTASLRLGFGSTVTGTISLAVTQ